MLEWHVVSSATYYGADQATLNDDYLYFLTDTAEIYKGSKPFSQAVEMLVAPDYALPTTPARKRIYVHPTTLEGKIYDGTNWVTVIRPVEDTVSVDGVNPVNSKAVIAYVAAEIAKVTGSGDLIASLSYDKSNIKLTATDNSGTATDLVLEGIGVSLTYDKATGALNLKDVSGAVLGSTVNLDLERFVKAATYDSVNKKIVLSFNDTDTVLTGSYTYPDSMPTGAEVVAGVFVQIGDKWYEYDGTAWAENASGPNVPLEIDVGDLVDTYTAESSTSIALTVTSNKFKAEAIVAATAGNMLQSTATGLYVAATDLSNYQTLIGSATAGNLVSTDANGQVTDSGKTAGGATLADTPTATTLATEAAVKAAITALNTALTDMIATKMALVSGATAGNILTVNASGQATDSGKTAGGATLAATPNATTLATEAAVKAAVDGATANVLRSTNIATTIDSTATDTQVASAKVVHDSLSWKTTL